MTTLVVVTLDRWLSSVTRTSTRCSVYEERSPDEISDSEETTVKEVVSSRRSAYSTRRNTDDCEAEGDEARNDRVEMQPAQNEMLTYITYYYQRNSIDVIKKPCHSFIR